MEPQIEYRAWHIAEKKMCSVAIIDFNKPSAFLVGIKPNGYTKADPERWNQIKAYENVGGLIVLPTEHGRLCSFGEFNLMFGCSMVDKHGKKWFGGDIIKEPQYEPEIMEIRFVEGAFCAYWGDEEMPIDINHFYHSKGPAFEIIGNIYETPQYRLKK